jgi:hypothetical protein
MTTDAELASTLSQALGPLFRVSLVSKEGKLETSFGGPLTKASTGTAIPLPRSSRSLLIEIDEGLLGSARRAIEALAAPTTAEELPAGTFTHVDRAIEELISVAEAHTGKRLSEMSRSEKRGVVRFLNDRGAFNVRKSVETVADALGVSRFTVYNYLDAIRET